MELALNMGAFEELDQKEMMEVDGGTKETAGMIMMIGGAILAGVLAPLTCGASVATFVTTSFMGYTLMGTGMATYTWG